VKIEGSNRVRLGAATPDLDLDVIMGGTGRVWCCYLYSRDIFLAWEIADAGRRAGPDIFPVPCALEITVNSANGTLALHIAGGEDLGVVIDARAATSGSF
jgi:hypothetical protein